MNKTLKSCRYVGTTYPSSLNINFCANCGVGMIKTTKTQYRVIFKDPDRDTILISDKSYPDLTTAENALKHMDVIGLVTGIDRLITKEVISAHP